MGIKIWWKIEGLAKQLQEILDSPDSLEYINLIRQLMLYKLYQINWLD